MQTMPTDRLSGFSTNGDGRKPIRVMCVGDRPGWCFARRIGHLRRFAPPDMLIDTIHYGHTPLENVPWPLYDVVFCLPPGQVKVLRKLFRELGLALPIVASWNSGPGRTGYNVSDVTQYADYTIVNNWASWQAAVRDSVGEFRGCHVSNGVDLGFYAPLVPMSERPRRMLALASKGKAEDEHDVKGFRKVLMPLQKIFAHDPEITTDFRAVDFQEEMTELELRDWYNSGSVFVVASSSEGTPNVALEAMACGCVPVATPVGNMPEIVRDGQNGVLIERTCNPVTPLVLDGIKYAMEHRERLSRQIRADMLACPPKRNRCDGSSESIGNWDWPNRCSYFYEIWRHAAAGTLDELPPFSYLNVTPAELRCGAGIATE
jgi:Glycosyl transferases group 1